MPSNPRSDQTSWERRTLLRTGFWLQRRLALMARRAPMQNPTPASGTATLPNLPSAGAPGDPVAIANASLQASAFAAQTTFDMGRKFLGSLDLCRPTTAAQHPALRGNRVCGRQAVEYVIRRAGTPDRRPLFPGRVAA